LDYRPILVVERFDSFCSTARHVHEKREEATGLVEKRTGNISEWRQVNDINKLVIRVRWVWLEEKQ
jgi:hypothetical protein